MYIYIYISISLSLSIPLSLSIYIYVYIYIYTHVADLRASSQSTSPCLKKSHFSICVSRSLSTSKPGRFGSRVSMLELPVVLEGYQDSGNDREAR